MNELILVVDDEPKIVKLARDYLEQSGFAWCTRRRRCRRPWRLRATSAPTWWYST